jgi:signal transduction histidine kinase
LSEALKALVDRWVAETGVSTRFKAINGSHPLPPRVEVALYRICQEALTNVARHADAGRVVVRLLVTPDEVRLVVMDDGRGFDPSSVAAQRHGIVGMKERADTVGGLLEVESATNRGTRLEVAVPLGGAQGG